MIRRCGGRWLRDVVAQWFEDGEAHWFRDVVVQSFIDVVTHCVIHLRIQREASTLANNSIIFVS